MSLLDVACMVCFSNHRFNHKNPEDPSEVPGGFITDCNKVRFQLPRVGWLAVRDYPYRLFGRLVVHQAGLHTMSCCFFTKET